MHRVYAGVMEGNFEVFHDELVLVVSFIEANDEASAVPALAKPHHKSGLRGAAPPSPDFQAELSAPIIRSCDAGFAHVECRTPQQRAIDKHP